MKNHPKIPKQVPPRDYLEEYKADLTARYKQKNKEALFVIGTVMFLTICVIGFIIWSGWVGSCKDADIYNKTYDTNYTCDDVFWSKDVIKKIHDGETRSE